MWSPCDGYSLVYFDEDSGDVVWKIDSSANFSGKASNVTGTVSVSNGGTG
jgi:outer membrane protein assembly factor BamB